MATPTPTLPSHPSSASKRTAGHVSTPSHLGFSPAPRSVPSPATMRKEHSGKTPINHPTTSSHGSKTLGGTPMIHNLSQQGLTSGSSPGANMLSFGTPVGLGVEGITPGTFNMATPAMAGVPMGLTMSDLGINASAGAPKRNEDEERRAKMRKVLKSIGKPKGRVSQEGIARISRRVGFDTVIDPTTVTIAGKKLLIDVALEGERPESVSAQFATENAGLQAQNEAVGKALLDDLQGDGEVMLLTKLDRFARNLERLAAIDRLSSEHFDAFEALSGIYTSLRRLYAQEICMDRELEVVRKMSGRPEAHAEGEIGLNIAYWQQSHLDYNAADTGTGYSRLRLGIERSPASLHPSLRVSDAWLPDPCELRSDHWTAKKKTIPWQDPPPTLVSAATGEDAMVIDSQQSLLDLRFTAKLDPPVILPWQLSTNLLQSFGLPVPQLFVYPPAWHAMLLNPTTTTPFNAMNDPAVTLEQAVLTMSEGEETEITHAYALDVPKPDGGFLLSELPFSHPRQLIELLPTLRQWAYFGSLVKGLFGSASERTVNIESNLADKRIATGPMALDDLLTPPTTPPADKVVINVSLATSPVPTVSFEFPNARGEQVCEVSVQVMPNGVLSIASASGLTSTGDADGEDGAETKKLGNALEACSGDIGVWIEWLRSRSG